MKKYFLTLLPTLLIICSSLAYSAPLVQPLSVQPPSSPPTLSKTRTSQLPPIDSPSWKLDEKKGQISVYTSDVKGSDFTSFKAVSILHAPIANIMAIMNNPKSCVEWVENCITSYGFGATGFHHRFGYTVSHLPWPFKDRDLVVEININNNPKTGVIFIRMSAVKGKVPKNDNNVRILIAQTTYQFSKINANTTKVVWLQYTDPTGSLPSWLVNFLIVDIPMKSLQKLGILANTQKYQNSKLIFNSKGILSGVVTPKTK